MTLKKYHTQQEKGSDLDGFPLVWTGHTPDHLGCRATTYRQNALPIPPRLGAWQVISWANQIPHFIHKHCGFRL